MKELIEVVKEAFKERNTFPISNRETITLIRSNEWMK